MHFHTGASCGRHSHGGEGKRVSPQTLVALASLAERSRYKSGSNGRRRPVESAGGGHAGGIGCERLALRKVIAKGSSGTETIGLGL